MDSSDSESDSDDEEGGVLLRTGNLLASSVERLPKETIAVTRLKDANRAKRAQAVVKALEFHPTANVLLTAGYHKTLDLFQVLTCSVYDLKPYCISSQSFIEWGRKLSPQGQKRTLFFNCIA